MRVGKLHSDVVPDSQQVRKQRRVSGMFRDVSDLIKQMDQWKRCNISENSIFWKDQRYSTTYMNQHNLKENTQKMFPKDPHILEIM